MRETIETRACAKINLSLEVIGRRGDGYHQVATVLHKIDLADGLAFKHAAELRLTGDRLSVPQDRILVLRAARLLQENTGCSLGAEIALRVIIPVGTGLGGGSSDAATTLKALDGLWDLGLSDERLTELAAELGSDVPFFIRGGCALGEGRGELVTPLPPLTGWWVVLLVPPMRVKADKTGSMYSLLTGEDFSDGSVTRCLSRRLAAGNVTLDDIATGKNAFEKSADIAFPGLNTYRQAFLDAGAPFVRLCGSGPAFFSLFERREMGVSVRDHLRRGGQEVHLIRLVGDAHALTSTEAHS